MRDYPDSDPAIWAQTGIAVSYIQSENPEAAQSAIQTLKSTYPLDTRLPGALYRIGERLQSLKEYIRATEVYQTITDYHQNSESAIWAQRNMARMHIVQDDDSAGREVTELISKYADRSGLVRAVNDLAGLYRSMGKADKSYAVLQQAIDQLSTRPESATDLWSRTCLIVWQMYIDRYIPPEDFDAIYSDFADNRDLPNAINLIGETYFNLAFWHQSSGRPSVSKEYFQSAIVTFHSIIDKWPEAATVPEAYFFAAQSLDKLDRRLTAIPYYDFVASNWPGYHYAAFARLNIALSAENMISGHKLSVAEGAPIICDACRKFVTEHPRSRHIDLVSALLKKWEKYEND